MSTRVPQAILAFNSYLTSTDTFLQADADPQNPGTKNWQRLGLTQQQADDWHARRVAWDALFGKYSNEATRTKPVNHDVEAFVPDFRPFSEPILNTIANSASATSDDESTFNLVRTGHRKAATHTHTAISEKCFLLLTNLGGCRVRFVFTTNHDGTRASMPEGADSALVAVKLDGPEPQNDEGLETYVITQTESNRDFGLQNKGKYLYCFVRWYNTKNPDLAGPISSVVKIMLAE